LVGRGTISSEVLPRAWPDQARFRNALFMAAPSSTQKPTHLMLPLHLAPDMQTGVAWTSRPVLAGPLWPPDPGPCSSKRETARAWVGWAPAGRPASRATIGHCYLSAVDLGWAMGTVLYISTRAFPPLAVRSPPHGQICRPRRVIPLSSSLSVGSCFFPVSSPFWNPIPVLHLQRTRSKPSPSPHRALRPPRLPCHDSEETDHKTEARVYVRVFQDSTPTDESMYNNNPRDS
jgi:hypothetical protein